MKKRLLELVSIFSFLALVPSMAGAAAADVCAGISTPIGRMLCMIQQYLNTLIPIMIAVGVVYFVWGVVQFVILGAGDEAKKTKGKQFMIWGIIALAVMVSVWGLVNILNSTFNIKNVIPQLQTH